MKSSAVKFIATPYEPGVSVREDIASNLFKIVAYGRTGYKEPDSRLDFYYLDTSLDITGITDITSAVLLADHLYRNNAWEYRNPDIDYSDEFFEGEDAGPQSFNFQYLEILDRYGKRVMSASYCFKKADLHWETCIVSEASKNAALDQMKVLAHQASEERRGDNYDSARWFDLLSEKLLSRVVTSPYNRQAIIDELERSSSLPPKTLSQRLQTALENSSVQIF
ncbi:hypothetical protein PZE02_004822 [Salmonella enterica subsp. enterica serovar Vitkin]|uniref:Uncharacterized protein n=3 Tax=Salmonella enterica TaxID=28901 RepID=A0A5Z6PAJ4_SALET|nr:hypothetical protein [Salmonella enterica]EBG5369801.1 hypothetical protein [Salmonella enterica subsp. enterica serovar Monschaui]EBH8281177.1 hypothetical protein [Salmonella enterica subsp. enterica serovar Typhimurium str. UK-1]EBP3979430.1 hypothetical protein [Salmonella enterica subsp. enterica]EBS2691144.1 hypothetical protein [Salmonella enterica subsp. enterica serovar Muenchen]EBY0128785.1 hypothetical protein [Salmonella enterica subsp. enterica serovar Vitkin]EBY1916836.1 hypo